MSIQNNKQTHNEAIPKAMIFGCQGMTLTDEERTFFAEQNPLGFILFARNIGDRAQVKVLVDALRDCVGRDDAPVLIDQEGGRVARLKAPEFRDAPPAGKFASLAKTDIETAREGVYLNARLMAKELHELGISVDCAPVADLNVAGAHDIIGDRAYGDDPEVVSILAGAVCEGLQEEGVVPVIKHIPGHGRAKVDSHEDLPIVGSSRETLEKMDFQVFKALKHAPWAMTAHIIYQAIDPDLPATLSPEIIRLIREDIGFQGVLISDDLSMKALKGSFADRTKKALIAGCDVVLHCNGKMSEMQEIADSTSPLTEAARARIERSFSIKTAFSDGLDMVSIESRLGKILEMAA